MSETRRPVRALLMLWVFCWCAASLGAAAWSAGPVPYRGAARARGQARTSPPRTALPMLLVGVMVDSADPSMSACLIRCTPPNARRSASFLEIGANACDIAEIREIREDAVVLRNLLTSQLEVLPLQPPGASPGTPARTAMPLPAPDVVQLSPDVVNVELPKESVNQYLLNLSELLNSARAIPRFQDAVNGQRVMEGFELGQIREGSVLEQLGLRNGDLVVEVNGERLDSLATVMRLFGQAQSLPRATLTVLRGTQRMTFVLNVK